MTVEEQRLAEMLHRLTPDPPRLVTVEDIASRQQRGIRKRERSRWMPALAAASVLVVVGTSAGIGMVLTSHHGKAAAPPAGGASTTPSDRLQPTTTPRETGGTATVRPLGPFVIIRNGPWDALLIHRDAMSSDTLVGSGNLLYAISDGYLLRIDPENGNVLAQAAVQGAERPVVSGNTVWVAVPNGSGVVLHGYNATTLAPTGVSTALPGGAGPEEGALAAGPNGDLYVAAGGSAVAVVDSSSGSVIRRIPVTGQVDSVAVSPDGSRLYVGANGNGSFSLLVYNPATGKQLFGSAMADGGPGGYLVATPGGVWGTTGNGMAQRTWFASGGSFENIQFLTTGASGGLDSVPTYSGGTVWIGGTHALQCLNPSSGKVLATTPVPADGGVPEHFGSLAYANGHIYATYQDQRVQLEGVAAVTPPSSCAA